MRIWLASVVSMLVVAAALSVAVAARQPGSDERRALRERLEQRYDIVPLSDGVALTPKTRRSDVRLIEVSDTIAVNGTVVTGRELRDRVGSDADDILRVSYLDADARRSLFARQLPAEQPPESPPAKGRSMHRAGGDRVRIFGNVQVREDEEISGQVVAVIGSVRIDGHVGDEVVAVLGSVDLGPKAVVDGDITSVGGRVRRADGSQVHGAVTEVSLADGEGRRRIAPWIGAGGVSLFDGFAAVPRLLATTFRLLLLLLFASLAMILARGSVEASAHRVSDDPIKSTLVGIAAEILTVPILVLTAVVLAISLVGIPLLLLLPFVVLLLGLIALVGFSGTAFALGQWARRRFAMSSSPGIFDACLGVVLILSPVLLGRVVALAGWPASPISFLLIAMGVGLEFLAWSAGFGAVLTNAFSRWQSRHRVPPPAV